MFVPPADRRLAELCMGKKDVLVDDNRLTLSDSLPLHNTGNHRINENINYYDQKDESMTKYLLRV